MKKDRKRETDTWTRARVVLIATAIELRITSSDSYALRKDVSNSETLVPSDGIFPASI